MTDSSKRVSGLSINLQSSSSKPSTSASISIIPSWVSNPFASNSSKSNVISVPRTFGVGLGGGDRKDKLKSAREAREQRETKWKGKAKAKDGEVGSLGLSGRGRLGMSNSRKMPDSSGYGDGFVRSLKDGFQWLLEDEGERDWECIQRELEKKGKERERKRLSTILSEEEEEDETQLSQFEGGNIEFQEDADEGAHKRHLIVAKKVYNYQKPSVQQQPLQVSTHQHQHHRLRDRDKTYERDKFKHTYSHSPKHSLSVSNYPTFPLPTSALDYIKLYLFHLPVRTLRISRISWIILLFLGLLGLIEMFSSLTPPSTPPTLYSMPYTTLHTNARLRGSSIMPSSHQSARIQLQQAHLHLTPSYPMRYPHQNWNLASNYLHQGIVRTNADTTAILLSWKRRDNIRIIVEWLCRFEFFKEVWIWNNDPDFALDKSFFKDVTCPPHLIRITNSPSNMLFSARFLACAQASTPYCYFQDDDFLIPSLRSAYSIFTHHLSSPSTSGRSQSYTSPVKEDKAMLLTLTDARTSAMGRWEWCFFAPPLLHTCFAWLGTGAFTTRTEVKKFLERSVEIGRKKEEVEMADMYFVIERNESPIVVEADLISFEEAKGRGYSDGEEGRRRNRWHIQNAVQGLTEMLELASENGAGEIEWKDARDAWQASTGPTTHFSRATSVIDVSVFWTNIQLYPSPAQVNFPYSKFRVEANKTLNEWENELGWIGRGWLEPPKAIWEVGETWAVTWGYGGAVDGNWRTAFRSLDVVTPGDAVGLAMLKNVDVDARAVLHVVLEYGMEVLQFLVLEVSIDEVVWHPLKTTTILDWDCQPTPHVSTLPSPTLPNTSMLSDIGRKVVEEEEGMGWWVKRRRRGRALEECSIQIDGDDRWRWVRIRAEKKLNVGWGVYEMWVDLLQEE